MPTNTKTIIITINRKRAIARAVEWYNAAEHKDIKALLNEMITICEEEATLRRS